MTDFLIFQLAGQMAAWGNVACGEKRPTFRYSTKSAIIGIIGAALGLERTDAEAQINLSNSITIAIEVFRSENFLLDYHTTQTASQSEIDKLKKNKKKLTRKDELSPQKLNTILSDRDYCLDVYYRIGISIKPDSFQWSLADIQDALLSPRFHLYLGRKSCPLTLPLKPHIISADSVLKAFQKISEDYSAPIGRLELKSYKLDSQSLYFDKELLDCEQSNYKLEIRRDFPLDRNRWEFRTREEIQIMKARAE